MQATITPRPRAIACHKLGLGLNRTWVEKLCLSLFAIYAGPLQMWRLKLSCILAQAAVGANLSMAFLSLFSRKFAH
jgi:hypothetical protein